MRALYIFLTLLTCLTFKVANAEDLDSSWQAYPEQTLTVSRQDDHVIMTLIRDDQSPDSMSFVMQNRDLDVAATTITFTLDLKVDTLGEGAEAMTLLRFDDVEGEVLDGSNSEPKLAQTDGWQTVELTGDVEEGTATVVAGFILVGEGTVHFRHPRFKADGEPSTLSMRQVQIELAAEPVETSGIAYDDLKAEYVPALQALGEVWGFLKYHHPEVTTGAYHWDLELFAQISQMLEALAEGHDSATVSDRLHAWLDELDVEAAQGALAEDIHWLSEIPPSVATRLVTLTQQNIRRQTYVAVQHGLLNFGTETAYPHLSQIDGGFALLSLFRMAGVYEYFAPYRDLAPHRHQALANAIESLTQVDTGQEQEATILAMRAINRYLVSLQDGHVDLSSRTSVKPLQGECTLPAQLIILDRQLVIHSLLRERNYDPAFAPGHIIQQIDGADVSQLLHDSAPYYSGSTPGQVNLRLAGDIGLGACEQVALSIEDAAGNVSSVEVERIELSEESDIRGPVTDNLSEMGGAVYIHLHAFNESMYPELAELLLANHNFIIDVRGYPREFVALSLAAMFAQQDYDFVRLSRGSLAQPGQFEWLLDQPYIPADYCEPCLDNWQGRIALLVDETTVSQGEYTVMALQGLQSEHIDVQTIGSTTAGTNGNMANIPLPGPIGTRISGIGVFYPDGTPTQQRGVRIDRPVAYTLESIRAEQDAVLEAALDWLNGR